MVRSSVANLSLAESLPAVNLRWNKVLFGSWKTRITHHWRWRGIDAPRVTAYVSLNCNTYVSQSTTHLHSTC
jgi:hypothetical protein